MDSNKLIKMRILNKEGLFYTYNNLTFLAKVQLIKNQVPTIIKIVNGTIDKVKQYYYKNFN